MLGKMTRMMRQLSARSLRHMRQIKHDVRKIAVAVESAKSSAARPDPSGSAAGAGTSNVTSSSSSSSCLPEFIKVGAWPSCYRFSKFNASWHDAREYCSAFGTNLLALDSLKEAHIIDYLLNSKLEFQESDSWWTSGNFMVRNQRWMWTSKHHLKPITYSRWALAATAEQRPLIMTAPPVMTSAEQQQQQQQHCLLLEKALQYHWNEANCADRHNFICEDDDAA